ncbi:acyl carrier protein [Vagococcus acidifermentans]|uniref:Acyl carrier protein n=1 Tax=Vagococcus acidifermentans TaxID=564710 RepID=A0A430AXZ4_9ENTE|nr:acyl carrier protein [Vagococcus acidifermentans]RSU12906.1 acyl carrier protein [Vagococcus acidifermentans]
MTTFEKIQEIIVDQLGKDEEEVQLTTNFREELDADSLDLFQIINDIEDAFEDNDVKIETDEGLNTVQDLVDFVDEQIKKNS